MRSPVITDAMLGGDWPVEGITRDWLAQQAEMLLDRAHRYISMLDQIDGDPDLEDDDAAEEAGDEHDAAFIERIDQTQHLYANMRLEDDEDDGLARGNVTDGPHDA